MARSPENWRDVMRGKTPAELAHFVTSDLVGYRSTSLHRSDDEDSLTYLFIALGLVNGEKVQS